MDHRSVRVGNSVPRKNGKKVPRENAKKVHRNRRSIRQQNFPWLQVAIGVVVVLGVTLRVGTIGSVDVRSPDERNFTRQAKMVQEEGVGGVRTLVQEFRDDTSRFMSASPTRAGYLWILAGAMSVTGLEDERAGAYLSCAASVLSLLMLCWIGWRFFNPTIGVLGALFYAFSPIELAVSRRCWQEAPAELLILLIVFLACEITRGSRRSAHFVLLGLLGAVSVTIKESSALGFMLCLAWVLLVLAQGREWRAFAIAVGSGVLGVVAGVLWISYNLGSVQTLIEFSEVAARFYQTNQYSIVYEGGSPYLLIEALWTLSPVILLASGVGIVLLVRGRSWWPLGESAWKSAVGMSIIVLIFVSLSVFLPHKQNPRYIASAFGMWYLLGALGLWYAITSIRIIAPRTERRTFGTILGLLLLLAALSDYRAYQVRILGTGIQDLTVRMLLSPTGRISPAEANIVDVYYAETRATAHPSAERYVSLSLAYFEGHKYNECITAARNAVKLDPNCAPAYNNMSAAYQSLSDWDNAVETAQKSVQLDSTFSLAKRNLAFSIARQNQARSQAGILH